MYQPSFNNPQVNPMTGMPHAVAHQLAQQQQAAQLAGSVPASQVSPAAPVRPSTSSAPVADTTPQGFTAPATKAAASGAANVGGRVTPHQERASLTWP